MLGELLGGILKLWLSTAPASLGWVKEKDKRLTSKRQNCCFNTFNSEMHGNIIITKYKYCKENIPIDLSHIFEHLKNTFHSWGYFVQHINKPTVSLFSTISQICKYNSLCFYFLIVKQKCAGHHTIAHYTIKQVLLQFSVCPYPSAC